MQYGSKANLSTKSCSDISELEKLVREIAQKLCKKLLETKKVARNTASCQKGQLVESSSEKGGGGGGRGRVGGHLIKLCSERLRPEVQSLTLIYTIFDKGYPFRVSSIEKLYPFHVYAS